MKSLNEIIKMIDLQEEVARNVISTYNDLNIEEYDEYIKQLLNIDTAPEARSKLKEALGLDPKNIKMLTCMLYSLTFTYEDYQNIGITEEVFIPTMKCFTRFIQEHYNSNNEWGFDRDWWTYRQIAMTIFRIGELEYETRFIEGDKYISIHIPSDAKFSIQEIKDSISQAKLFFRDYFPDYTDVEYRCHSWLLSPSLKGLLPESSNILKFQSLFNIIKEDYSSTGYIEWVFKSKYQDYKQLPEDTTLQRNMKKYLLSGGLISIGLGILK